MIGEVVGKYRVVGQLGRGAMGTVYRAVDETLYREVAIKVLNPDLIDTPIMKRFRSEATVLARLNHPVIATIYELFTAAGGDTLIVMELVPGETLERICTRGGPLAPAHAAHIIERLLSALDHAHRAGIVHCDIKPANIMVTAQGDLKIMDFGTARVPGKQLGTADKYMMGTPAYMSPEQVTGQSIDGRSDLYAVGVVLYRMLAGVLPFNADSLIGLMQKQIAEEAAPLKAHRDGLPEWCEPIVRRAMSKAPADRFQTAGEFSAALRTAGAVMRQPVGVAHPDPVTTAAAVERRVETPGEPTVHWPQPTGMLSHASLKGATIALSEPPFANQTVTLQTSETLEPSPFDWRPAALVGGSVIVFVLVLWRFGGGSLDTPPAAPPTAVQTTAAPATSRGRSAPQAAARTTSNPSLGAAGRGTALPPQGRLTSNASAQRSVEAPPASTPGAPAPASEQPKPPAAPVVFEARYLGRSNDGPHEVDSRVVLADGKIHVQSADGSSPLTAVSYEDVQSIHYSHGRDPMWNAPGGPEQVAKAGGGAFGIFHGTRHWISLRTTNPKNRFVVLRLGNDVLAKRALAVLEERTGRHAQTAASSETK